MKTLIKVMNDVVPICLEKGCNNKAKYKILIGSYAIYYCEKHKDEDNEGDWVKL